MGHEGRAGGGTVDPADSHRLEDGEQQQTGSAAREVVVDLEDVEAALQRPAEASVTTARNGGERKNKTGSTHRRYHDQAHQEADQADGEQQQLAAVAPPHLLGVEVSHRGHQGLKAHKLHST